MRNNGIKVVLLNGPPRCGKDEAAKHIDGVTMKFARPVKRGAHAAFGFIDRGMSYYEDSKDKPSIDFYGATPREVYISFSEDFMKKISGEDIFGHILRKDIVNHYERNFDPGVAAKPYIISDSGFKPEAEALVSAFGKESILLIRIHRDGCDYSNDSRTYISLSEYGVKTIDIENKELDNYINDVKEAVRVFLNDD